MALCDLSDLNFQLCIPDDVSDKKSACQRRRLRKVRSLGWEDPLEEGMATHSSILAWRIPWAEEPGGLRSMGHTDLDTTKVT